MVFTKPIKYTDNFFTLLAIKNQHNYPRLGLAVAKKNIKKAVSRNFVKRIIRENFRLVQHKLINVDIVILTKKGTDNAPHKLLKKSLDKHFLRLISCN